MLLKLKILISTLEEVVSKEPNDNLSAQLETVKKIKDRISQNDIILASDLKYCNRLFKKAVNKLKQLRKN